MNIIRMIVWYALLVLVMDRAVVRAQQFRGPQRDGHYDGTGLLKQWPEAGPPLKWTATDLGRGCGSAALAQGQIYVNGRLPEDANEILTVLDTDGKPLWRVSHGLGWPKGFPGSNSTPTVVGDRVFLCSGLGQVTGVDIKQRSRSWTVDVNTVFSGHPGPWGVVESLLVVDDSVIVSPCGTKTTLVALDTRTGATRWQSPSLGDKGAYVSPVFTEWGGHRMIVTMTSRSILAVDVADGQLLWSYPYSDMDHMDHPMTYMINTVMPIVHQGRIFVTSGYDHWAVLLEMQPDGQGVKLVWKDRTLDNHHGGVVLVDGCLYGSNWVSNRKGHWVCQDWATGKVFYETEWQGKGAIVTADGWLYCLSESGIMALVKPGQSAFEVISQFQIPEGKGPYWAHPTIAQGMLYIRHNDRLYAYDLKAKP